MNIPPNKRFYGAVTVNKRGQIVIPDKARRDFGIQVGDKLLVLGDLSQGIAFGCYRRLGRCYALFLNPQWTIQKNLRIQINLLR
jgi:AbrB family looped-hinge helix DNA binding protein